MKLLDRTLRTYLLYSFVTLLVTVPIFYVVVRHVLLDSVDQSLREQVRDIRANLSAIKSVEDLHIWSELDKDILLTRIDAPEPDRLFTDDHRRLFHHREQDPLRRLTAAILVSGQYYRLTVSTSLVENEDLLGSIVIVDVALMLALLGGLLWINQRTARRIWAPFYATLARVQEYELNKSPELRLEQTDILEFRDLNLSLENLVQKNYAMYQSQREFTENASHEMQTPLAIFQNGLETLMQTQPLTEVQASTIHTLEMNIQRLSRINRSLLLLAKLDNGEYPPAEFLDLNEIVKKYLASYHHFIEEKALSVSFREEMNTIVRANRSLTEILIGNLLSNATRHNTSSGQISIMLDEEKLQISNTGIMRPIDTEKMFRRFNKSSSTGDGNGLGLAIVKKICDVNNFVIRYRFKSGVHLFELLFKPTLHE